MTETKLTLPEWKERCRASREVDRVERQHALQHFRNHWRSILCDQLMRFIGNATVGFVGGLVAVVLALMPVLEEVSAAVSKVCGNSAWPTP